MSACILMLFRLHESFDLVIVTGIGFIDIIICSLPIEVLKLDAEVIDEELLLS